MQSDQCISLFALGNPGFCRFYWRRVKGIGYTLREITHLILFTATIKEKNWLPHRQQIISPKSSHSFENNIEAISDYKSI